MPCISRAELRSLRPLWGVCAAAPRQCDTGSTRQNVSASERHHPTRLCREKGNSGRRPDVLPPKDRRSSNSGGSRSTLVSLTALLDVAAFAFCPADGSPSATPTLSSEQRPRLRERLSATSRIDSPLRAAARIVLRQYLSFSISRCAPAIEYLPFPSAHTSALAPCPVPMFGEYPSGNYRREDGFTGRLVRQPKLAGSS